MTKPNPASNEAIELGCTCPRVDNHFGKGYGDGTFWINDTCPVHGDLAILADNGGEAK